MARNTSSLLGNILKEQMLARQQIVGYGGVLLGQAGPHSQIFCVFLHVFLFIFGQKGESPDGVHIIGEIGAF